MAYREEGRTMQEPFTKTVSAMFEFPGSLSRTMSGGAILNGEQVHAVKRLLEAHNGLLAQPAAVPVEKLRALQEELAMRWNDHHAFYLTKDIYNWLNERLAALTESRKPTPGP